MDCRHESKKPELLKTLACNTIFPGGNLLIHLFVLNNSAPNEPAGENFISAVLRSMYDAPGRTVNAWNDDGYTPLHLAILKRNFLMVRKLLSYLVNIDIDKTCRYSPDCVEDRGRFDTPLHLATKFNDLSIIQELCDKGAGVDIEDGNGRTALYIAARRGRLDAMKLLVTQGADVNAICDRFTPLAVAALYGNLDAVKYLVMCDAYLHYGAYSPLECAVESEDIAMVEFLISKGAAVNTENEDRETSLHVAASRSSTEVVECLLRSSADVNARRYLEETPLHVAAENGQSKNAKLLLEAGADANARDERNNTPLHHAVRNVKLGLVNMLLERGADVNAIDEHYETPLHLAVKKKNELIYTFLSCSCEREQDCALRQEQLKIARLLKDEGANLRAIGEEGKIPHHETVYQEASRMGKDCVCKWINVDPAIDSRYRKTAKVIRLLLDKGADVSARNRNGQTPLDLDRNKKRIDALQDII